jgi:DNA (cytosine-5)-methyltransferase 1
MPHTFYEFFAGGGMARAGLGDGWTCSFANDCDAKKGLAYAANWGAGSLKIADVASLKTSDLPGVADVAWASFPCQDLSLAGVGAGLTGARSGTFWPFWRLMQALKAEKRMPSVVVLENVCGALSSHKGQDFAAICTALAAAGYRFGACVLDAVHFVPQSRSRLFIVAVSDDRVLAHNLTRAEPDPLLHTLRLIAAYENLSKRVRNKWIWWRLPAPVARESILADLVEEDPQSVLRHTPAQTQRLLSLMSPLNRRKVEKAKERMSRIVGCVYRRTRIDENRKRVQRAEIRFDDVAGCLRTPTGGSSRQTIVIVEGDKVLSRLLSPREAARLMGLPDDYKLPENRNAAYHLLGDGLVVPVVRFLAATLLEPLSASRQNPREEAAA